MSGPDAPGRRAPARYDPHVVTLHRSPSAYQPSQPGSPRRRLAAVGLLVALVAFGVGGISGADAVSAAGNQDPTITTTSEVFGTDPSGASDAPTTTMLSGDPSSPTTSGRSTEIDAENRRIAIIVGGLIAVALALILLTVRYWRATRPVLVDEHVSEAAPEVVDPSRTVDRIGRRSRRAVAGADHATADETWESRATGEQPRVDPPAAGRPVRPSTRQRAAALEVGT